MLIYLVTNIVNGKKYIGQTVRSLSQRKQGHITTAKLHRDNNYFHSAIIKHGEEAFDWKILHDGVENIDDLNKLEVYYIGYYDTFGKGGYNLTLGGRGSVGCKRTDEYKRKMSITNSGKNHPQYGKTRSAETKLRLSEAGKGRVHSAETRKKQSIANSGKNSPVAKEIVINSRHFDTRNEAAVFLGITPAAVRHRILHKTKWLDYYYAKSEK